MNEALEALKVRFRSRCAEDQRRLQTIEADDDREGLKMLAHKIAGAAGVFGFDALGRAAREVEEQIDLGLAPGRESLAALHRLLAEAAQA